MSRLRWIVPFILVGLLVLALGGVAYAQDKTYHWERFDVTIAVQPNGDFVVEETQAIAFTSGEFRFGYRNIPTDRLEQITDVQVWEGNRQYQPGSGAE